MSHSASTSALAPVFNRNAPEPRKVLHVHGNEHQIVHGSSRGDLTVNVRGWSPRSRTHARWRRDVSRCRHWAPSIWARTQCSCRADIVWSQGDRATRSRVSRHSEKGLVEPDFAECMRGEEMPVRFPERRTFSAQPREFPQRDDDGDGFAASCQFDLLTSFCLIDDGREIRARLSNGISSGHAVNVHRDVQFNNACHPTRGRQ